MARRFKIPVLGWTPQRLLIVAVVTVLIVAVVWRVSSLRKLVTGS